MKPTTITVICKTTAMWAIGRQFSQSPAVLEVVEKPTKPNEISADQYAELKSQSAFFNVLEGDQASASAGSEALAQAQVTIAALQKENVSLKAQLANAQAAAAEAKAVKK